MDAFNRLSLREPHDLTPQSVDPRISEQEDELMLDYYESPVPDHVTEPDTDISMADYASSESAGVEEVSETAAHPADEPSQPPSRAETGAAAGIRGTRGSSRGRKKYNPLFSPTVQGYKAASGHTELRSVDDASGQKDARASDATGSEEADYCIVSTADGVLHRRQQQQRSEVTSGNIFINQNNYFANYNHYNGAPAPVEPSGTLAAERTVRGQSHDTGPVWKKPYLAITYLQSAMNTAVIAFALFEALVFFRTIRRDVGVAVENKLVEARYTIQRCYRQYHVNHCHDQDLPALEESCMSWMKCMNKEPHMLINYSEVIVAAVGSVCNEFLESLSLRSLVFLGLVVLAIYAWNFSCGYARAKSYYGLPLLQPAAAAHVGDTAHTELVRSTTANLHLK